jgi:WD40 repeat protein
VHRELDWWLGHRSAAPIVVDVTGEGTRWVPQKLTRRWPNAQRVNLDPDLWASSTSDETATLKRQVAGQILGGIAASEISVVHEDLDKSRRLNRRLLFSISALLTATIGMVVAVIYAVREASSSREQQQLATANRLATQAELALVQDPERAQLAGLLAIEAIKRGKNGGIPFLREPNHELHDVIELLPSQVAYLPMHEPIAASYSKDGRFLAVASYGAVTVWATNGFKAHTPVSVAPSSFNTTLSFAKEDRYLLAADDISDGNGTVVSCWEMPSATLISRVTLPKTSPLDATLTIGPKGEHIVWLTSEGDIDVLEVPELRRVAHLRGARVRARKIAFDQTERYLAALSDDGTVHVWEWLRRNEPWSIAAGRSMLDFTFAGPDAKLITVAQDGVVSSWDVATHEETAKTEQNMGAVLVPDPPSQTVVVEAPHGGLSIMELPRLTMWGRIELLGEIGSGAPTFTRGGKELVLAGGTYAQGSDVVRVWDLKTLKEIGRITEGVGTRTKVISGPGPSELATLGWDGIRIWDVRKQFRQTNLQHDGRVWALDFSADGRHMATASNDGTARIWDVESGDELQRVQHAKGVIRVKFSPDGRRVATASYDGFAQIANVGDQSKVLRLEHDDHVYGLAWTFDGRLVTAAGHSVVTWDANSGRRLRTLTYRGRLEGGCLAVSAHNGYVATYDGKDAVIVDGDTGREVKRLPHRTDPSVLAFDSDGKYLVTSELDRVHVWQTETWQDTAIEPLMLNEQAIAFNPTGTLLALGSKQGVTVFDVAAHKILRFLPIKQSVMDVAFSHDGKYLGCASWDGVAHVWETNTFSEEAYLPHVSELWGIAFSPDDKHLATNGMSSVARVWLYRTADVVEKACLQLTRNMSYQEWHEFVGDEPLSATCSTNGLDPVDVAAEAEALAAAGDRSRARVRFGEAARTAVESKSAARADVVCLSGGTWGFADSILSACDLAVASDPDNARYRDSRGIARALLHDNRGAIEDFTVYIGAGAPATIPERRRWIEMLQAGKNPVDDATLKRLRSE